MAHAGPGIERAEQVAGDEDTLSVRSGAAKSNSEKLLNLLMLFADRSDARSVEDLARELELPHSTIYRYTKALADVGLMVAVSAGSYILGPSIIMLDRQMRLSDPLIHSAEQIKERLAKELPAPGVILLCRLFRNSVMCVDSVEIGKIGFDVSYARGRGLPLYRGAASKAILAHIPLRNVRARFDGEPGQFIDAGLGSDWKSVKASLRKIRQAGIVVTHGEVDRGALGISSPVLGPDEQIIGSLGYVTPDAITSPATMKAICEAVKAAAEDVQRNLIALAGQD
jgi:DNA-binding IclR family transcriptional regulator